MTTSLTTRLARIGAEMQPTAVIRIPHDRVDLHLKLESSNPSGSTKDRSAYAILRDAAEAGLIEPGTTVVESSSGNFAVSLMMFCRRLGLPFVPVIDPTVNAPTEHLLRLGCYRVVTVADNDGTGYLNGRIARVQQLRTEIPGAYWPNQYANPAAARGHDEFTGAELCDALPHLDYVFVGVGTGASLAGISRRVKRHRPAAKVVAVDAEGSVIFGGAAGQRRIPGIGSSIQPGLIEQAIIDDVVVVAERDAVLACRRLLASSGVYAGGSTGSTLAAIDRYFADYRGPRPTVAFLSADRGAAYTDTVYNDRWVLTELGLRVPSPRRAASTAGRRH